MPFRSYPPVLASDRHDPILEKLLSCRSWVPDNRTETSAERDLTVGLTDDQSLATLSHNGFALFHLDATDDSTILGEVMTMTPDPILHAAAMRSWAIDPSASIKIARPKRPSFPVFPPPTWAAHRFSRRWPDNDPQPAKDVDPAPIFVIGAPRSGTTYLGQVLRHHPNILLTNETRMMVMFSRILTQLCTDEWALLGHAAAFVDHLDETLPDLIASFYEKIGAREGMRWGDKYPHYADMRAHPLALVAIDRIFPNAQFVHILRDPIDVVGSITRKGWVSESQAWDVWARHVVHAREFGQVVGPERFFEIRYDELIADGIAATTELLEFLGVTQEPAVWGFLKEQELERTPFSLPTTDIASTNEQIAPDSPAAIPPEMAGLLRETGHASRLISIHQSI
ncbi:MAG: sulfotransferase [Acidimicrobiia bacterium]|nr:sulfotransferase [Acidimicrobiia bacterium]MDH5503737.1 sulfotransferase [Acidimicrobiia bacterium]